MKTIGYVCQSDPFHDRKAWSGTIFKIRESIEKAGYKVIWIPSLIVGNKKYLLKLYAKVRFGIQSISDYNSLYFKAVASEIDKSLTDQCDYLFFPGGVQAAAYLDIPPSFIIPMQRPGSSSIIIAMDSQKHF